MRVIYTYITRERINSSREHSRLVCQAHRIAGRRPTLAASRRDVFVATFSSAPSPARQNSTTHTRTTRVRNVLSFVSSTRVDVISHTPLYTMTSEPPPSRYVCTQYNKREARRRRIHSFCAPPPGRTPLG